MISKTASISVVIPCYNAAAFLREAIDSALSQTRPADEIIVVDDASTDDSVEMALSYGDRIRLLRSPNAKGTGHGAAANRGIMASRGDYIAFLHADDIWVPQHLEKVAGLLDKWPEAVVAFSRMRCFGSSDSDFPFNPPEWDPPQDAFATIMRTTVVMPSCAVVRRTTAAEIGGFDEGRPFLADDFDFFVRCSLRGQFVNHPEQTVRYRVHDAQCSTSSDETLLNGFRYRVRLLDELSLRPDMQERWSVGQDRAQRRWEEWMEQAWRTRNLARLKKLVRYGMGQPLYRTATQPYALKSRLPGWVLRVRDCCRR